MILNRPGLPETADGQIGGLEALNSPDKPI